MSASERKAVIKNADMSEQMQQAAIDCAFQAMEKYNIEKDIAAFIKKVSSSFIMRPWRQFNNSIDRPITRMKMIQLNS